MNNLNKQPIKSAQESEVPMQTGGAYVADSLLFRDQFGTEEVRNIFCDASTVQRWLDVEAALAKVQGRMGIIPQAAADEIVKNCLVKNIDLKDLKREMDRTSHPIVPLLRAMKEVCDGDAGEYIHWGATTQDIIDTGTILQIKDAIDVIQANYQQVYEKACALALQYRDTTMVGRSHGQQALPITFGFKVAVWADELRRNLDRIEQMRERVLVGQLSGAVGTLAALGDDGIAVQEGVFEELGLATPNITWHVSRDRIAEMVCVLAMVTATLGKIANEVYSLQKTETSELEEPFAMGKVGSSTMPHKRNPPSCETVMALSRLIRSSAPVAIEAIMAEHERDKVVLQTEREFVSKTCLLADAAAKKTAAVLAGLNVYTKNMESNLFVQNGLLLSEAVMMSLSDKLGRQEAHEIVYKICMEVFENGGALKDALMQNSLVCSHIAESEIDAMLDPHVYTGLAATFVDRVVSGQHTKSAEH